MLRRVQYGTGSVAKALGVSTKHVVNLIDRGTIKGHRIGVKRVVRHEDLEVFLKKIGLEIEFKESPLTGYGPMNLYDDILEVWGRTSNQAKVIRQLLR